MWAMVTKVAVVELPFVEGWMVKLTAAHAPMVRRSRMRLCIMLLQQKERCEHYQKGGKPYLPCNTNRDICGLLPFFIL